MPPANKLPGCGGPPADVKGALEADAPDPFDPPELLGVSTWGALRSLVSARFNLFPAWICFKSSLEAMIKWVMDEFNTQLCRNGWF
jgi:hypothetical protein